MSKDIIYICYDEALDIYRKMIDASDGGFEECSMKAAYVLRLILYRMIYTILPLPTS